MTEICAFESLSENIGVDLAHPSLFVNLLDIPQRFAKMSIGWSRDS